MQKTAISFIRPADVIRKKTDSFSSMEAFLEVNVPKSMLVFSATSAGLVKVIASPSKLLHLTYL